MKEDALENIKALKVIGAAVLIGELIFCFCLFLTMKLTRSSIDNVVAWELVPGILIGLSGYNFFRLTRPRSAHDVVNHWKLVVTFLLFAGLFGVAGLVAAMMGGPHLGPTTAALVLVLQLATIGAIRLVVWGDRFRKNNRQR